VLCSCGCGCLRNGQLRVAEFTTAATVAQEQLGPGFALLTVSNAHGSQGMVILELFCCRSTAAVQPSCLAACGAEQQHQQERRSKS
jgi:hypothetical protein